jgi:hypothetical protein
MPLLQHPARVARPQVPFHVARPAATRFAKEKSPTGNRLALIAGPRLGGNQWP